MLKSAWRLSAFQELRLRRSFSVVLPLLDKPLPPRRVLQEDEITESFLKGSGPGGQKINKTSSAVQLKHIPTGIVVKCQGTRSREQNRKDARRMLAEKLDEMEKGDQSRTAIKTERARSKKASSSKKSRRKYKLLAEEKVEAERSGTEEQSPMADGSPTTRHNSSADEDALDVINKNSTK